MPRKRTSVEDGSKKKSQKHEVESESDDDENESDEEESEPHESDDEEQESDDIDLQLNFPVSAIALFSEIYCCRSDTGIWILEKKDITTVTKINDEKYRFEFIYQKTKYHGFAFKHRSRWVVSPVEVTQALCDKVYEETCKFIDALGGELSDYKPRILHVMWPFELDNYGSREENVVDEHFEEVLPFPLIFDMANEWDGYKMWCGINPDTLEFVVRQTPN